MALAGIEEAVADAKPAIGGKQHRLGEVEPGFRAFAGIPHGGLKGVMVLRQR
jgi:hypothetical protein